ncbi:alcohol dehydrogenase [Paenibacillus yonginensis]|uniref:Alcohol dehydrogenase n=1 Tax=Paenibacillus yonginensis TaxID=1462996 RepID=A0A1B1N630_9BACL|nr:aldo/keto reductase [Paenibacillus yonginensis]ANS76857.1 alcohol dehydrogenase [Paenibacillus yonginensis]
MQYVRLGNTGMRVSRLALCCMSYGDPDRGNHTWTLNEEQSRPFIKRALELGINFFDTANVYSDGTSEEIVGRALKDFASRDEVVIATKVHGVMRPGPNGGGLSRKAIMSEIDNSLKRLGTDYVDLYQIHRWDYNTPIEETMEALHDVVKAGKARYIGVIPWSPLARGRLTRDWEDTSLRSENDNFARTLYTATEEADRKVAAVVKEIAEARGVPRAQIALAWVLQKQPVTAPIIGATKTHHLEDAVSALEIVLTADEIQRLEEPYVPHPVTGFA